MAAQSDWGWDYDRVRSIVVKAADRSRYLFDRTPWISLDDMISEGMIRAKRMHDLWDAESAQYHTWITRGVQYCWLDMARAAGRQLERDHRGARVDAAKPVDATPLLDWIIDTHRLMLTAYPGTVPMRSGRRGRPAVYTMAQVATVALALKRWGWSIRQAAGVLADPALFDAMGLRRAPSWQWVAKTSGLLAAWVNGRKKSELGNSGKTSAKRSSAA